MHSSVSVENQPVIAEPVVPSTSLLEKSLSSDVVVASDTTPHKIRKGVPHWFQGKVSPAFESHLFWPSPPKKRGRNNAPKMLFPACASTSQWREHHRQQIAQRGAKPPSVKKAPKHKYPVDALAGHNTASISRPGDLETAQHSTVLASELNVTCAKPAVKKRKKTDLSDSDNLETRNTSKETMPSSKSVQSRPRAKT